MSCLIRIKSLLEAQENSKGNNMQHKSNLNLLALFKPNPPFLSTINEANSIFYLVVIKK